MTPHVKQTVNGTTIYSVYGSQGQLLHRLNATTNTATDYIHIANTTVAEVERVGTSDTVRYPYFDHLGSPVKMGNASGGLISSEQAIFLPFGERWGTTTQAENGRGFTGHVDHTELGLTYMQARYYDPVIGRFYSNDPVGTLGHLQTGNIQGFNRYAYANNNPYSYMDPDGRDVVSIQVEYNIPTVLTMINALRTSDSSMPLIPEGGNLSVNFSFPGASDEGQWGAGISINGVYGMEAGVEGKVERMTGIKSAVKSGLAAVGTGSITAKLDYSFSKDGVVDVQNGVSDGQVSANVVVGGGQLSVDEKSEISGLGIKVGAGVNFGTTMEVPIGGVAFQQGSGWVVTGGPR